MFVYAYPMLTFLFIDIFEILIIFVLHEILIIFVLH